MEDLIERSVHKRRKRKLMGLLKNIRAKLSFTFNQFEDYLEIEVMPHEVCKNARAKRSTICKEENYFWTNKGYSASQGSYYFAYKLLGIFFANGIFQGIDLTPVMVHDIHFMREIQSQNQIVRFLEIKAI